MKIAQLPKRRRFNNFILIILIIGLPLLVGGTSKVINWFASAGSDAQPKNVILSNLTESAATISWVTDTKSTGSVVLISNGKEQVPVYDDRSDNGKDTYYTHIVTLKGLSNNTKYSFKILSGSTYYTMENGDNFSFSTANASSSMVSPASLIGDVKDADNNKDLLVYLIFTSSDGTKSYPVTPSVMSSGGWVIDLSTIRNSTSKELFASGTKGSADVIAVSGSTQTSVTVGIEDISSLSLAGGNDSVIVKVGDTVTDTKFLSYFPDVSNF